MKGFSGFGNTPLNKKRKLTSTEEDSPNPNRIYVSDKFKIGDVLDEDDTADVEYGSKKKKEDPTLGTEKKGSDALKISLNQGATGSGTGGVNQP